MKKITCLLISAFFLISLCGCEGIGGNLLPGVALPEFDLRYEINKALCLPGEVIKVTATAENISNATYSYTGSSGDYFPAISLRPQLSDGTLGKALEYSPIVLPTDVVRHKIKKGDIGSCEYEFTIPDTFLGKYTITLSFAGQSKVFPDALEVTSHAQQNFNEEYNYSSTVVSSGGYSIKPLEGMVFTNEYVNGELGLCGDGSGVYFYLDDPEIDRSTFPTIYFSGDLTVTPPEHVKFGGGLYISADTGGQYNFKPVSVSEISDLPAGEYLILFAVNTDTRNGDDNIKDYWLTQFECLFRLIVPKK